MKIARKCGIDIDDQYDHTTTILDVAKNHNSKKTKTKLTLNIDDIDDKNIMNNFLLTYEHRIKNDGWSKYTGYSDRPESYVLNISTLIKVIQNQQKQIKDLQERIEVLEYAPGNVKAEEVKDLFKKD